MEGYRVHEWGAAPVWEAMADPTPGPGEVRIEVEACSVGLTVLNCINGDLANAPELLPRVPGHELVGRVVELGEGVDGALMGRRVVAYFYLVCGECAACRAGSDPLCRNLRGWVGVHVDGGYAPQAVLPARNAIPVPSELDPVAATIVPDAVATPVHVSERAGITHGDRVVVLGAGGGVGIHMVQVAQRAGADVAGFEITAEKLSVISDLGAVAVDSTALPDIDPGAIFVAGRPTVIVDLLGLQDVTRWSLAALDMGGRLVSLTTFRDRPVPVESRDLVFKEISILGSRYSTRAQVAAAGELVASGRVTPVIGAVVGPAGVPGLHERLRNGQLVGRGALDWRTA